MAKRIEINQGDRYNRLTIIKEVFAKSRRSFLCKCDCGNKIEVMLYKLRNGHTTSCGCYHKEKVAKTNIKIKTTHGLSSNPLYCVWLAIKNRCYNFNNKQYHNYGGRGIKVCKEWCDDVESFIKWCLRNGYKKGLEIDRIDNNGNYEPNNCRFIDKSGNQMNKRKKKNCSSKYRGVSFYKATGKWMASVAIGNGKQKYLGLHDTELEAVKAYDAYIVENNLPNKLNFS